MTATLFCFLGGAAIGAALLFIMRRVIGPFLARIMQGLAIGGLMGALWLSSVANHSWSHGLCGLLVAPLCLLPIINRLSDQRISGMVRAAAGLGADPGARLRFLWLPLLRLPVALSLGLCVLSLSLCLVVAAHD